MFCLVAVGLGGWNINRKISEPNRALQLAGMRNGNRGYTVARDYIVKYLFTNASLAGHWRRKESYERMGIESRATCALINSIMALLHQVRRALPLIDFGSVSGGNYRRLIE